MNEGVARQRAQHGEDGERGESLGEGGGVEEEGVELVGPEDGGGRDEDESEETLGGEEKEGHLFLLSFTLFGF